MRGDQSSGRVCLPHPPKRPRTKRLEWKFTIPNSKRERKREKKNSPKFYLFKTAEAEVEGSDPHVRAFLTAPETGRVYGGRVPRSAIRFGAVFPPTAAPIFAFILPFNITTLLFLSRMFSAAQPATGSSNSLELPDGA